MDPYGSLLRLGAGSFGTVYTFSSRSNLAVKQCHELQNAPNLAREYDTHMKYHSGMHGAAQRLLQAGFTGEFCEDLRRAIPVPLRYYFSAVLFNVETEECLTFGESTRDMMFPLLVMQRIWYLPKRITRIIEEKMGATVTPTVLLSVDGGGGGNSMTTGMGATASSTTSPYVSAPPYAIVGAPPGGRSVATAVSAVHPVAPPPAAALAPLLSLCDLHFAEPEEKTTKSPPSPTVYAAPIPKRVTPPPPPAAQKKSFLARTYLARDALLRPKRFVNFNNCPLGCLDLEILQLDPQIIAQFMGSALAILHWICETDARDVEFVLGGDPLLESTHMYVLDFNQVRDLSGVPLKDRSTAMVEAMFVNDPYFPAQRGVIWDAFSRAYMGVVECLKKEVVIYAMEVLQLWITGLEKRILVKHTT